MTGILPALDFIDDLCELIESKENPGEWYVLMGSECGEYSIYDAEQPEEVPEEGFEDEQPANKNVDGFYQIGSLGWSADAFEEDFNFVAEAGFSKTRDVIDRRATGLLLVHESALSKEALEAATPAAEAEA